MLAKAECKMFNLALLIGAIVYVAALLVGGCIQYNNGRDRTGQGS